MAKSIEGDRELDGFTFDEIDGDEVGLKRSAKTSTGDTNTKSGRRKKYSEEKEFLGLSIEEEESDIMEKSKEIKAKKSGKKTTTKKINETKLVEENVSMMLRLGSGMLAERVGEHWNISDAEANSIAEPLARIMERLNLTKLTGKYMDYISLVTAVGMVVVPRIMISNEGGGRDGRKKNTPNKTSTSTTTKPRESASVNTSNEGGDSGEVRNSKNIQATLSSLLEATG